MDEELPKIISIMPERGPFYASDEEGGVFSLTDIFEDHIEFEKLRDLEERFLGLAVTIDSGIPEDYPDIFSWDKLNEAGLAYTRELAGILGEIEMPIIYVSNSGNLDKAKKIVVHSGKGDVLQKYLHQ